LSLFTLACCLYLS